MNLILFDSNSTNTTSATLYVAPGSCILINSWNLGAGEVAQVFRLLVATGAIPSDINGSSCSPSPAVRPADILQEEPYLPCNSPVQVGETGTQDLNSLVLSQPGFYNLHLTPAALGTAFVEAVFLSGDDACRQAAEECCCGPAQQWNGSSANPCLTIIPGGVLGLEPVFDIDACCLIQQIVTPVVPDLTNQIIILQGGACGRASLDDVFNLVNTCSTLAGFPLLPVAAGDTLVGVDNANACKRLDAAALVTGLETPWAGVSVNPNLTIAPGGVNGHAPTFDYDWCGDMMALPSCACEPSPGDGVAVVQGGACVLATWPTVDLCDQIGLLTLGALLGTDLVPVREAGGVCKVVAASDFTASVVFPILAPDGSCAAPSYSFASAPDSGMFYDLGAGAVVIGDTNCGDFIEIGASINITSTTSNVTISAGAGSAQLSGLTAFIVGTTQASVVANAGIASMVSSLGSVQLNAATFASVVTNSQSRVQFTALGEWLVGNALDPGAVNEVLTSGGAGVPPTWAPVVATVSFPLLAPTSDVPQYSFTACPAGGLSYRGDYMALEINRPGDQGSMLSMLCATVSDMVMRGETTNIPGGRAALISIIGGEAQGINAAPFQQEGGSVTVKGGRSFHGVAGTLFLEGGDTVFGPPDPTAGGHVRIRSGTATAAPGNVFITSSGGGNPGYTSGGSILCRVDGGFPGSGTAGVFQVDCHNAVNYGDAFVFQIPGFAQFRAAWYGVVGDTVNTTGQLVRIWGGQGLNSGLGGDGGDVHLMGGNAAAAAGHHGGQLFEGGDDTAGGGRKGYVQLERVVAVPVAAPTVVAGFTPMVFTEIAGVLQLHAWRTSDNTWRAVTFV